MTHPLARCGGPVRAEMRRQKRKSRARLGAGLQATRVANKGGATPTCGGIAAPRRGPCGGRSPFVPIVFFRYGVSVAVRLSARHHVFHSGAGLGSVKARRFAPPALRLTALTDPSNRPDLAYA
jgi:hypothetical protein